MGHMEFFEFTDFLSGEIGVKYVKPSLVEIQAVASKIGYVGKINATIVAFPPKPPAVVLAARAERERLGYLDGKVEW